MQTDAPIMIILGTLVVITSMASLYTILGNFGGDTLSESESNVDHLNNLQSNIEDQCERLSEYDTILNSTVDFQLNDAEISYDEPDLVLEEEGEEQIITREIKCDHDIEFTVHDDAELGSGSQTAEISGEDDLIEIEVS